MAHRHAPAFRAADRRKRWPSQDLCDRVRRSGPLAPMTSGAFGPHRSVHPKQRMNDPQAHNTRVTVRHAIRLPRSLARNLRTPSAPTHPYTPCCAFDASARQRTLTCLGNRAKIFRIDATHRCANAAATSSHQAKLRREAGKRPRTNFARVGDGWDSRLTG